MPAIIVTGASRGIGKALAEIILSKSNDTKLVVTARSLEPLKALVTKYGVDRVAFVEGDISSEEVSKKLVSTAVTKFGGISGIVLNAGVLEPVTQLDELDVNAWKKLFDINFFSAVQLVHDAIPELRRTSGQVIFVSSGASTSGYSGWGAYGSSKAALNHFALTLSTHEPKISSISIAPGVVDTAMQSDIRTRFNEAMGDAVKKFVSLKETGALLNPEYPATIFANLLLRGIPAELNGKYLRYSDEPLKSFTE
ncbi:unnamed protein product [Kuraishia capsulata CBS 1993]|uniref:Ketoreductase domain-containing protein n=1 Tax=Kuraishia capsulata CBS 1993 TaxID=1382522 RepID=W6MLY7_9ASCO|nr:uncharacterized protein KUCA_T00003512001 [Kuraishia capsulata CBS 1993]CDK27534.1 unnamed protein product [Kuraishia capsulata CBS 1993]